MALFGFVAICPDNPKRQTRAIELFGDCETINAELAAHKTAIDGALTKMARSASDAAVKVREWNARFSVLDVGHDWRATVPSFLDDLLSGNMSMMQVAALASLSMMGISPLTGSFADVFGLPAGFPRVKRTSLISLKDLYELPFPWTVLACAEDSLVTRTQLQKLIHALYRARPAMKHAEMVNAGMLTALDQIADFCDAMSAAHGDTDPLLFEKMLDRFVQNQAGVLAAITRERAEAELKSLDTFRHAWCDEDVAA